MTGSKNTGSTTRKSPAAKSKMSGLGVIGELDRYYYGEGRHYKIFEKLGAHPFTYQGKDGYYFAVWAPHAVSVSVVGDFNGWNPDLNPMMPVKDSGIYEALYQAWHPGSFTSMPSQPEAEKFSLKQIPMLSPPNTGRAPHL